MACIVYRTNKKNGVVYAFRSESYRDPVTKQPKSRRTYLGRVDPVTKEIIPKAEDGKRNRSKLGESLVGSQKSGTSSSKGVPADIVAQLNDIIRQRDAEIAALKQQHSKDENTFIQLRKILDKHAASDV